MIWRMTGWPAWVTAAVVLAATVGVAWLRARRLDRGWLITALDARLGEFEDSSGLLFEPGETHGLAGLHIDDDIAGDNGWKLSGAVV